MKLIFIGENKDLIKNKEYNVDIELRNNQLFGNYIKIIVNKNNPDNWNLMIYYNIEEFLGDWKVGDKFGV